MSGPFPRARRQGLVIQELPGETVVYDRRQARAYCLNPAAAAVFRLADGSRGVPELARLASSELGEPVDPDVVRYAADRLRRAKLLEDREPAPGGLTRRELARRLGAAVALPTVVSVLAPTFAQAATCSGTSGCCRNNGDCCPGMSLTCQGPQGVPPCITNPYDKRCF